MIVRVTPCPNLVVSPRLRFFTITADKEVRFDNCSVVQMDLGPLARGGRRLDADDLVGDYLALVSFLNLLDKGGLKMHSFDRGPHDFHIGFVGRSLPLIHEALHELLL